MRFMSCLIVGLGMAAPLSAQSLDEILAPRHGTYACWQRTYSDAHLARHPRQKVVEIRFALDYYEMEHHEQGAGNYGFSVDISTRERNGSVVGRCYDDETGGIMCGGECDAGVVRLRNSGSEGSVLLKPESGGLRLTDCESDTPYWMPSEPDDKLFLLHPVACNDPSTATEEVGG